jgi:putative transposase
LSYSLRPSPVGAVHEPPPSDQRNLTFMTPFFKNRRSLRLSEYDYSQSGAYFITICVRNRRPLLGTIMNNQMQLNSCGKIAETSWQWLSQAYDYVELDDWIVMPNHFHGIILISPDCRGGSRTAPTGDYKIKPLGRLIGAFKTTSTKQINSIHATGAASFWQRNFYEHVIRDDHALNRIREYVTTNPLRWNLDRENPQARGRDEFDNWLTTVKKAPASTLTTVRAVREPPPHVRLP